MQVGALGARTAMVARRQPPCNGGGQDPEQAGGNEDLSRACDGEQGSAEQQRGGGGAREDGLRGRQHTAAHVVRRMPLQDELSTYPGKGVAYTADGECRDE